LVANYLTAEYAFCDLVEFGAVGYHAELSRLGVEIPFPGGFMEEGIDVGVWVVEEGGKVGTEDKVEVLGCWGMDLATGGVSKSASMQ